MKHLLENSWEGLEEQLALAVRTLRRLKVGQAIPKKKIRKRDLVNDPEFDAMTIPPSMDLEELMRWKTEALANVPYLERRISRRKLTLDLMIAWGDFQYDCAMVVSAFTLQQDDPGRLRAGVMGAKAVSKDTQRTWVARELLRHIDTHMKRYKAEETLARDIRFALAKGSLPAGLTAEWLQDLLDAGKGLKGTYCRKRFSMSAMKQALECRCTIPALPATHRSGRRG